MKDHIEITHLKECKWCKIVINCQIMKNPNTEHVTRLHIHIIGCNFTRDKLKLTWKKGKVQQKIIIEQSKVNNDVVISNYYSDNIFKQDPA